MKCPYRTITKKENDITTIDFAECYYSLCPWYIPKSNDEHIPKKYNKEDCQRCHTEHTKAMALNKFPNQY